MKSRQEENSPFAYHEEVDVTIGSITNLGLGIARVDGWVIQVPYVLPEEKVRVRVFKNYSNYSQADLVEVLQPSPDRVEAPCSLFGECGGCQYQHAGYPSQLAWKKGQVEELLQRLVSPAVTVPVSDVQGSPEQLHYRSKLTPHFGKARQGDVGNIGFLRYGRRAQLVDVEECLIATQAINEKLGEERERVRREYSRKKKGGTLLLRDVDEGVVTDAKATVTERVGDSVFQFKAGDFFQNNPYILPKMVEHVLTQAQGSPYLVDAYCGVGLFAIAGRKHFEACSGIEVNVSAVQWARNNALINNATNVDFHVGEAEKIFERLAWSGDQCSLIIDPPRKGCDAVFLQQLLQFAPARVVYVSCDPSTQARDLNVLLAGGYVVTRVQPFDLFPHTRHIENVITLQRKD